MKNKIYIGILIIILLVIGIIGIGLYFPKMLYSQDVDGILFIASSDTSNIYNFGNVIIKQKNINIDSFSDEITIIITIDNEEYLLLKNEEIVYNDIFKLKLLYVEYVIDDEEIVRWRVDYQIVPLIDNFISFIIDDNQQKLINNDNVNIKICNNQSLNFDAGVVIKQHYENGKEILSQRSFQINQDCKNYLVNIKPKYLGRMDSTFYFYLNLSDNSVNTIDVDYNEYECMDDDDKIYISDKSCGNDEIINVFSKIKEVYVINKDSKSIYSKNKVFYPYIIVNEIKQRISIDCSNKGCPAGYICEHIEYNNKIYNVCNAGTKKIELEQVNNDTEDNKYTIIGYLFLSFLIITFFLVLYKNIK